MAMVLMSHKYFSKNSPHKKGVVLFLRTGVSPEPLEMSLPGFSGEEISW